MSIESLYHERDDFVNTTVIIYSGPITDVMNELRTIADRLKNSRIEKDLSQTALAKAAGVSQGTIGNIESGERKEPRELLSIARALGVHPEWLKSGKGTRYVASGYSLHIASEPVPDNIFSKANWPFESISQSFWMSFDVSTRRNAEALVKTFLSGQTEKADSKKSRSKTDKNSLATRSDEVPKSKTK